MNVSKATADFLKETVDSKGMIDVGAGVEKELGISKEKLNQALYMLEREGYEVYGGGVPQVTNPGKQTNIKVLKMSILFRTIFHTIAEILSNPLSFILQAWILKE